MRACNLGWLCWLALSGRRNEVEGGLRDHGLVVEPQLGWVEVPLSGQLACTDSSSETDTQRAISLRLGLFEHAEKQLHVEQLQLRLPYLSSVGDRP